MAIIGSLAVNIVAKTDQLRKGLGRANKDVRTFDRGIGRNVGTLRKWHGAIGQAAGALGLGFLIRQQIREIDAIGKFSDRLGVSTEALIGLHHAANLSGVATSQLNMGLQRMTRRVAEAANDTGEAKDALRELGVNAQSLSRMRPDQQFSVLADSLNRVKSESDRVRLAFKLFDSEGVALLQMTQNGSEGLGRMSDEARQLGKTMDRMEVRRVEELDNAMTRLTASLAGLGREAVGVLAKITPVIDGLAKGTRFAMQHFERAQDFFAAVGVGMTGPEDELFGAFKGELRKRMTNRILEANPLNPITPQGFGTTQLNRPFEIFRGGIDKLTSTMGTLTKETTKNWQAIAKFPSDVGMMGDVEAAGRRWWAEQERLQKVRSRAFDFTGFQQFGRFFRDLSFRPQQVTPSMNAALEAGTREAFIAQRSGRRQEFLKEVARFQKEEVNISKQVKAGIDTLIEIGRTTATQVFSIPSG